MFFRCERCQDSFINSSCVCNPPNVLVSSADPFPSHPPPDSPYTHHSLMHLHWLVCNLQAGGLCFPSGSLSTNVNPSVNYAQLVSLPFPLTLARSILFILMQSDLCFPLFPPCRSSVSSLPGLSKTCTPRQQPAL